MKKCIFKTNFDIAVLMTAIMLTLTIVTAHAQTNRNVVPVKKIEAKFELMKDTISSIKDRIIIDPSRLGMYVQITEHPKNFTKENPGFNPMNVEPFNLSVKAKGSEPIMYAWFYKLPDQTNPITGAVYHYEWESVPENPMFSGMMTSTLTINLGYSHGFNYEFKCMVLNKYNCVWSNKATVCIYPPAPK